jgi:hypothetical protein
LRAACSSVNKAAASGAMGTTNPGRASSTGKMH